MDNLLDLSGAAKGSGGSKATGASSEHGSSGPLGEQRRYADVASDLARSRVFTAVLLDTGRLASFLREAVTVLIVAAEDVSGRLSTETTAAAAAAATGGGGAGGDGSSLLFVERRTSQQRRNGRVTRPEPLLRALCSFCLDHSPARSTFIQALLDGGSGSGGDAKGTLPGRAAAVGTAANHDGDSEGAGSDDPCAALFALCLHPHPPSAAAASTLLQVTSRPVAFEDR